MISSEYVRNLNRNYERVLMEKEADCKRYQYCILLRGGIKSLLPCNYRQIDDNQYLYYDISSSQSVGQMFERKKMSKDWIRIFLWSIKRLRQDLNRFLLDERNIVWSPWHIFQDLEKEEFYYMYLPYQGQSDNELGTFEEMLEFWADKIDYEDEELVSFVYHAYEQFQNIRECYLERQIFEDFNGIWVIKKEAEIESREETEDRLSVESQTKTEEAEIKEKRTDSEKKGFLGRFGKNRRKIDAEDLYKEELRRAVNGYAVCEDFKYGENVGKKEQVEEFGKTIYIEETAEEKHGLYTEKGELVFHFENFPCVLGKRKEDADYVLTDYSASRIHARFVEESDGIYLEDLNSTNGTYKNGLRMQPYEKRKLEKEDILRFGKSIFVYK